MPRQFLDREDIHPVFQHGGQAGAAEIVRREVLYPRGPLAALEDVSDRLSAHPGQGRAEAERRDP